MSLRALTPLLACAACVASLVSIVLGTGTAGSAIAARLELDPPRATEHFELARLDGTILDSLDLRGKVVVLDVWATWCGPCLVEIPRLNDLYGDYRDQGVEIIGVTVDSGSADDIRSVTRQHFPVDYTLTLGNERFEASFGPLTALPETFLLDQNGQIRKTWMGALPGKEQQLRGLIDELLEGRISE